MPQFLPYAWAVQFGNDLKALFQDRSKAEQYAANSHGVLIPLYDLRPLDPLPPEKELT